MDVQDLRSVKLSGRRVSEERLLVFRKEGGDIQSPVYEEARSDCGNSSRLRMSSSSVCVTGNAQVAHVPLLMEEVLKQLFVVAIRIQSDPFLSNCPLFFIEGLAPPCGFVSPQLLYQRLRNSLALHIHLGMRALI